MKILQDGLLPILPQGGRIVFTAPFEKLWVYLRLSVVLGMLFSFPLIGWEVNRFVGPALKASERRKVGPFLGVFFAVFIGGIYFGYRIVLPRVMKAAVDFGGVHEAPFLTVSSFLNVCLGILIFSALMLEIPVVMSFLSAWKWVRSDFWRKGRKGAFVVNAVVSAFLSPPDALSMILMMIPLQLLYEGGIWGARMAEWATYEEPTSPTQIIHIREPRIDSRLDGDERMHPGP